MINPQKIITVSKKTQINKVKKNMKKMIMINQLKINSPEFKVLINLLKDIWSRTKIFNSGLKIQEDSLDCLIFSCLDFTWLKKNKKLLFIEPTSSIPPNCLKTWIFYQMVLFLSDLMRTLKTLSLIKSLITLKQSIKWSQFTSTTSKVNWLSDNYQ